VSEAVRDADHAPAPSSPPVLSGERAAGVLLLRGGPFAGLAVAVVVVAGAVLVPVGLWRPGVALPVILVGLALAWRVSRVVPVRPVPVWSAALAVAVAVGEGLWAVATHGEHVIVRRDAGSYALYAQWIATRHGLPVHADLEAFGGSAALAVKGFTLESPAYFQVVHDGTADVVPQFLGGAPAVFSLGWWVGGWDGLLVMPALVSAVAIFAVAALAARLVGPRWAPLAAGSLAVAFPMIYVARVTYSEPVALALVATAAALVVDATQACAEQRVLGLVSGLTLGAAGLVRVDVLTEVALLLPMIAILAFRRHPAASWLAVGVSVGATAAAASAVLTSRPYLRSIAGPLVPLVTATLALGLASGLLVLVGRLVGRRVGRGAPAPDGARPAAGARPGWGARWAVPAGQVVGALVLLVGAVLTTRPVWLTVRQLEGAGASFVAGLQESQHLPVDGARTYAEWSMFWVMWWLGPALVLLAWLGFAAAATRIVRWLLSGGGSGGRSGGGSGGGVSDPPGWLVPLVVGVGSSVLTLWRPGITPDHPWADRRLVPVLLPTFVIVGTGVVAWAVRQARRRFPATLLVLGVATGVAALLAPPLVTAAPLAWQRTERGELGVVRSICAQLRPGDIVLAIDNRGFNEWPQVIRGVCGYPAAALRDENVALPEPQLRASAQRLAELARQRGRRLVLLAAGEAPDQVFARLGLPARQGAHLVTTEDPRLLTRPPLGSTRLKFSVWLAPWEPAVGDGTS
jgi:hypothetical protein